MCWIHRGLISSAVANVRGDMCDKFMKFIISMIALMLSFSITPIMVFDGYDMPAKKAENEMRRERREKARKEALEMIKKNGNRINSEIMRKCMQAIHVTPEIIYRVITVCRKLNVPVIVSPYEADAQISYLCRSGVADFAVSEDSDLIVYGCPKVLYKLGRDGKAMELNVPFLNVSKNPFNSADLSSDPYSQNNNTTNSENSSNKDKLESRVKELLETKVKDGLFKGLNHKMFVIMCVLSGTDYDNGWHISGMGLKVAYKLVLEHENFEGILKSIYSNTKWSDKLPELSYEALLTHYTNVYNIFLHNIVFNPKNNQLVHINPVYTLGSLTSMDGCSFSTNGNNFNGSVTTGTSSGTSSKNVALNANSSGNMNANLSNLSNNNLNLNINLLRGYNYVYNMSLNIVNKGPNFINVARGLVSVVDDMEINYMLTETDLEMVDSLPEHISSYNKLNKTSKKDLESGGVKHKRVKFDLYSVGKDGNTTSSNTSNTNTTGGVSNSSNKTQFVLITTLCDSSVFNKLGDVSELYKEVGTNTRSGGRDGTELKENGSKKGSKKSKSLSSSVGKDGSGSNGSNNVALNATSGTKRVKLEVSQVKKEFGSVNVENDGKKSKQVSKKVMNSSSVSKLGKANKSEKKRKLMELLNNTESYTVKRNTKVKTT